LAAFNLKGDVSKWYKTQFSEEERLLPPGESLSRDFICISVFSTVRAGKEAELLALAWVHDYLDI